MTTKVVDYTRNDRKDVTGKVACDMCGELGEMLPDGQPAWHIHDRKSKNSNGGTNIVTREWNEKTGAMETLTVHICPDCFQYHLYPFMINKDIHMGRLDVEQSHVKPFYIQREVL
jgi:hypothetical protein